MRSQHSLEEIAELYGLLENIKKELEFKKARTQSALLRQKTLEHQDKMNYTNELQRIRGYLSSYDTRFPIGTTDRLNERVKKLKELGGQIVG